MFKKIKVDGLDVMSLMNGLVFFAPVALLVRLEAGLTTTQFFILQAFLSVIILFFEIPTGKLTDVIGYRNTIIMSQIMLTLARALLLVSFLTGSLVLFFAEAFVEGIASCFSSGTQSSYLYEFFSEDEYAKKIAHVNNFGTAGFIISICLYAFLYKFTGLQGLLVCTIASSMCGLLASFTLKKERKAKKHGNGGANKVPTDAIKSVFCNPLALAIMIAFSAVSIVYIMINFFYVEKLQIIGVDEAMMTFIILGYSAIQLLSEKILDLFEGKYGRILIGFFMMAGVLLVCFGFTNNRIAVVLIMLILPLLVDIPCYILEEIQNKIVDENKLEEKRAETLSIMNMGVNLVEVIFLFDSAIFSKTGTAACFFAIGIAVMIISVIMGVLLIRKRGILSANREL